MAAVVGGMSLGFEIDTNILRAASVDGLGHIVSRFEQPTAKESLDRLLEQCVAAVRSLEAAGGEPARAVGIAIPGIVLDGTQVSLCANLPMLSGATTRDELSKRLGRPVFLENDANAAALAEAWHGAGRGANSLLFVTIGTGLGAGVVLGGHIWSGETGYAGEIGHFQIDPDGATCGCGSRGCLQTIAGAQGWARRARDAMAGRASKLQDKALDQKSIIEAASEGDPVAAEVVSGAAQALGIALGAAISLLNPARVVIGGEAATVGTYLVERISQEVQRRTLPKVFSSCAFRASELGGDGCVLGASRVAKVGMIARAQA